MNKFIAALLLVAAFANTSTAFTSQGVPSLTRRQNATPLGPAFEIPIVSTTSSTALNLKVDPNSIKGNKNESGNAKMAAYGGSVAIAVLLPIAFLIWSAVSK